MRITFILPGYPWKPSGGALVAYRHATRLAARGHDVTVVHARSLPNWRPSSDAPLAQRVRGAVRALLERAVRPKPHWAGTLLGVRLVYVNRPTPTRLPDADVIVATFWPTTELILELPHSKGMPVSLLQHLETWAGGDARVLATWTAPHLKLAVSRWLVDEALGVGCPPKDVAWVPNAVDHHRFSVTTPIEDRAPRVAMMYGRAGWKGGADGVEVLQRVKRVHPELQATLFGIWRRPPELPSWVEYVREPERRRLAEELYGRSAVFLCSSLTEGWGLPGAEAMASGCALVSTDNGGVRDYARHGVDALLAAPGDTAALAEHVCRLLEDDQLRCRLARAGVRQMRNFTWERSAAAFESVVLDRLLTCVPASEAPI